MKHFLPLMLAASCAAAQADEWTGPDKAKHFAVSGIVGFAVARQYPTEKWKAFGLALVPGLLKEISDVGTTGFSGKDMAANALGAALGVQAGAWSVQRQNGTTVVTYRTEF